MHAAAAPPLPELDAANRFFWTSGADGVLRILRCADCGHWLHPPAPVCPQCLGEDLRPQAVSGLATIEAVTVNHQAWLPGLPVPYVIAIVALDEQAGLRLTTNIVGPAAASASIGQRVRVAFENREDVWLPVFVPA
ncbi:Zn-ribbon domain-containing OB-fold protein [Fulvimonas soli]|uniref:Putative OB-fold protein n=1 Tax=Fulvimonas soli TaxID=155197 RepID=A0A316IGV2_9GAMM|nr:OB-fold domain-containing protein [Fulvimonas soli]PWK91906.1 putative OB-fold protein [Fulvimonas soli]TNY26033.1 DNA-binding protein [Fulvimonas soli]